MLDVAAVAVLIVIVFCAAIFAFVHIVTRNPQNELLLAKYRRFVNALEREMEGRDDLGLIAIGNIRQMMQDASLKAREELR